MAAYFPLFVNIEHKSFCVFGAGHIAARRIQGLLRFGAVVTVIAPRVLEEIENMQSAYAGQLYIEYRSYRMGEIRDENTDYVLAATDDAAVNSSIYRECRHKEIPVNNASDRGQCDFYFPAIVREDELVIGLTAGGTDHKKVRRAAAWLRNHICEYPDESMR